MKGLLFSRYGLYALFLMLGIAMSTWATRTPALKEMLQADTAQMGLVLLGFSCGSMTGILLGSPLTRRLGVRKAALWAAVCVTAGLVLLACVPLCPARFLAAAGLFGIGFGNGVMDIAGNIECSVLQLRSRQHFIPTMHGCYCLGTLSGAGISLVVSLTGTGYATHLVLAAALAAGLAIFGISNVLNLASAGLHRTQQRRKTSLLSLLRDKYTLLLCCIILGLALGEGAANDWLPLLMREGHGYSESAGTFIYLLFTAGMAAGRLTAPLILRRLRPERLIAACAVFAAIGIALAIFPEGHLAGALAVIFWGLGASLGFPLVISCAASGSAGSNTEHREEAGSRVSLVATVGYIDFLVSPPILGFLGQELGLRMAMLPVLGMVCMALVCALILGRLRAPQQA